MANILSQNEKADSSLKNFFVPSFAGGILYFLLGTILLLLFSLNQIINWVGSNYLDSADTLHVSIGVLSHGLGKSFDTVLGGRLGQVIVWSLVGALTYISIWFIKNVFNSFENDIIVDHYLHPKSYNRAGYWGSVLSGMVFFGVILILVVTYTYLLLRVIMPGVTALASSSLNDFHIPVSILYSALCVIIPAAAIYIWVLFVKVASHLWTLL